MIDQLITALSKEVEMSAEEIADTIWLALQMQEFQAESVSSDFSIAKEDERRISQLESKAEPKTSELKETPNQPPEEQKAGIYSQNEQQTSKSLDLSFKVPDARSLREPLTLARALKPLMRRIPSGRELVLDEAATIQRIADEGLWIPVLKPTLEPWLDLELVVDEAISMQIWRHTIRELKRLLKNYGIFRDVRVWGLTTDENEQVQIRRGIGATAKNQSPRSPKELIDPSGRRLVLVVSDCVSSLWRTGEVTPVLEVWAKQGSMAIVQMLPKWLWKRTALGRASEVRLRGLTPGVFNQKLIAKEVSLWDELEEETGVKVPVFTLEQDKVVTWAQMLSGKGSIWTSGYVFKLDATLNKESGLFNLTHSDLSAEQRVQAFRVTASPMARKLAGLLASAPVISLPIVRLIRETLLKYSQQVNVAEVFLGGLLKPLSDINADTNPDYVQYDFMDGVRDLLVDSVPSNYVLNVVDEVSKYVARKVGLSLEEFTAVLRNPQKVKDSKNTKEIKYFATVTAQVLRRLGGKYTRFAEDLEKLSKKYWLFQGNPKNYRMFDAIQDLKEMPWPLNRYTEDISVGDEVIIWVSGKESGIYAFGEIIEPVKIFEEVSDEDYWINQDLMSNLRTQPGPCIRFTTKLLDQPLLRKELKQDPILKNLSVIRINRGSIFKVTPEEWKRIHEFRNLGIKSQVISEKAIDYTQLANLLAAGKWKEADEETANILLKITNRVEKQSLRLEDIEKLPSPMLNEINQLWLDYSNNKFGFSVQKEIYTSLGGNEIYNEELWKSFGRNVGWTDTKEDKWLYYSKLNFDLLSARGHLPALPIWSKYRFHRGPRGVAFLSRQYLPITLPSKLQKEEVELLPKKEPYLVSKNNYQEENLRKIFDEVIPRNVEIFESVIEKDIIDLLVNKTVNYPGIPDDNNEASITSVGQPYNITLEPERTEDNKKNLFVIKFTLTVECQLLYYIFKADYYTLDDKKSEQISIDDWNDHYFSAEETYQLNVGGTISVKGDSTPLELSLLSENQLLEFLEETDISIDSITSIEVAA
ncbi:EVE domain-containing protein [Brasilonema sp. CT11]|nr:EVE domain-containing protein [Brasilonema sp. CT11]